MFTTAYCDESACSMHKMNMLYCSKEPYKFSPSEIAWVNLVSKQVLHNRLCGRF